MIDDKFIKKHDALETKTMKKMILSRGTSASKAMKKDITEGYICK